MNFFWSVGRENLFMQKKIHHYNFPTKYRSKVTKNTIYFKQQEYSKISKLSIYSLWNIVLAFFVYDTDIDL